MTSLWLLAQLRQPGRQFYADLSMDTFTGAFSRNYTVDRQFPHEKANRRRDLGWTNLGSVHGLRIPAQT